MAIIAGKTGYGLVISLLSLSLSGCGLTQKVADGTVSATKSLFYRQVKTLHLDIRAREAINSSTAGIPLSVVVRIYQLKDRRNFDSADYQALFTGDSEILAGDIIARKDVWLQPGGSVSVDMPMDNAAKFTGVVAMFLEPDQKKNTWRVVLGRDELDPDTPRLIEVSGNTLALLPVKDK
ncbi:TPA: type VI secretion system lipoprotein TssJ [Escherichia coli]|nr:type VI secretion system lipoprotein TssJ [Escherichia coli]HEL8043416.1 type VI secretion system lipoprotein TssJ [Escherichia coli]HEL8049052.1 type VI secretion system lipoprotein TssJ [Escherichia coli]HEL8053956.1 type VI secretion system lipoprotein TssJ [Escherichia coli]HEL8058538.1 type VI secretion system lipoprotein TssJ [Escherichia coli]